MKHLIVILTMMIFLISCNENKSNTNNSHSGASAVDAPLFKLDGKIVTRKDLPKKTREMVYKTEHEAYSKNQNIFKEYALRVYLGKKSGKLEDMNNPPELVDLLNIPEPSDKELKALFEQHKARMPKGVTFESMKAQIAGFVKSQKIGGVFQEEIKKMEASGAYQSLISAPVAPETVLDVNGQPQLGNKNSKIQVIEVSDYTCGHCQRAHPEVKNILKKFKDKINFTQLNFALRPEGLSGEYVKGAICAQKQNMDKFWSYHHLAFEDASKPHDHSAPGHSHAEKSPEENKKTVIEVAKKAKLDIKAFEACLGAKETTSSMMKTVKHLSDNGISGTPVFILNNKKLMGGVAELEKAISDLL